MASTPRTAGLLERERELADLEHALDAAVDGEGGAVLVTGDPGIGKTTLLKAAVESGRGRGFRVLSARADALEGELSFGVCAQLFMELTAPAPGGDDPDVFAGAAANARPILGGSADIPAAISEDRLLSLIHGLYWLCANLADDDPLLICVDDAHWADPPSLRFMHYLARRLEGLRAVLVLASRPVERGAPTGDLLAALAAEDGCTTLSPGSLSAAAVSALVAGELGDAEDEFTEACHRLSGGNPLYLEELLRSAHDLGLSSGDADALAGLRPAGVAQSVLARLTGLGEDACRLAEVTAVGGGRLHLRDAAGIAGLGVEDARRAADSLVAAAILDGGEPLRFAHPLVQSAVYASVPDADRAGVHLRVAELLSNSGAPRKAVAVHLLSAERGGGPWVVDVLEQAAGEEIAQGSPEAASRFLRRALEEEPAGERLGRMMVTLGLAETESGDLRGAERLTQAVEHLPGSEERAGALLALGTTLTMRARVNEATAAYERGLDELAGAGGTVARDLESMFSIGLDHDATVRAAALPRLEALIATDGIDETATGRALLAHAASERAYQGGSLKELRDLAARATASGLDENDPMAFWAYFFCAYAYNDSDDFVRADQAGAKALELARARGSSVQAAAACHPRSFLNLRRGEVEAAVADARATVDGSERGWSAGTPSGLSVLGEALLERGDLAGAVEACRLPGGDEGWTRLISYVWLLDTRGRVELEQGDAEAALSTFLDCGERCERSLITNPSVLAWRSGAALAASRVGDTDQARELAETELSWAEDFGTPRAIGVAKRTLGLVAGDDQSIELLREALAVFEESPARLEHARTLVELGAALRRASHRKESREPLREGLDMAHRCGAAAVAERAREELAAAGARPRRLELTGVESLTPSERRISAMASEGLSNPQIAQALFLTRRTVEMHLTNAYRKLDISSRDELPAALG